MHPRSPKNSAEDACLPEPVKTAYPVFSALVIFLVFSLQSLPNGACADPETFSIRTGAFKGLNNAIGEVERLRKTGRKAFHRGETLTGKGNWHVVYLEGYESRMRAEKQALSFLESGLIGNYLIRPLRLQGPERFTSPAETVPEGTETMESIRRPGASRTGPAEDTEKSKAPLTVEAVVVEPGTGTGEKVTILADGVLSPVVFSIEGNKPRLVVDIKNTETLRKVPSRIPVDSPLIGQIRTHLHQDTHTLRIVLDLRSSRDYVVTPTLAEDKRVCALVVKSGEMQDGRGDIRVPRPEIAKVPVPEGKRERVIERNETPAAGALPENDTDRATSAGKKKSSHGRRGPTARNVPVESLSQVIGVLPASSSEGNHRTEEERATGKKEKGHGRNMARGAVSFGIRHRFLDVETELSERTAVTDSGTEPVNLDGVAREDFPTSMHMDTLGGRFGLTDYLEIFADLGVTYHKVSDPELNLLYGGGLRLNLFQSNSRGTGRFYGALVGKYHRGDLEYEYRSQVGTGFRKETDWQELSMGAELGLIGSRFTAYVGGNRLLYREDTRREQLDNLPPTLDSLAFEEKLEEKNAYGLYGGVAIQLTPETLLNIEGQLLDRKSLLGSLEFRF